MGRRTAGSIALALWLALAPRLEGAEPASEEPPENVEVNELSPDATRVEIIQEPPRWPIWAGVGVAAAASAGGVVLGSAALTAANDGDPRSNPRSPAAGANVAFAIAGTAALVTVVLWFWQDVLAAER